MSALYFYDMELPIPAVTKSHVIDISATGCVNELHWEDQEILLPTMVCGMCVAVPTNQSSHLEHAVVL